ncbi:SDR family oxidoreductase [Mucilaginibacter sp. 21P]|uniref:SDR family oxidoreductase n=1 Tax=Mucilaginibacter sp. 21P TaxID=2778902 RepID=UPI001C593E84|nr:SDR family oxidoreductase [Mucilaginibacter sp. 21P]QXV65701.1 SDR family oxidoreductase [Mucilaginibacter sp. 21P]
MRVFVTGASGFVGSAVIRELIKAGHQVLGFARSDEAAQAVANAGADVHRGSLEDIESVKAGAAAADAVIHCGFVHDFSNFKASCELDRRVIETIASVLEGSNRPFIITSGTALLSGNGLATEDKQPSFTAEQFPRVATEDAARAAAKKGIKVSIVRLSPSVHGEGDHHGFVPMLVRLAKEKGISAYVDGGTNRWTGVHRLDAARLYVLALEKAADDVNYHASSEEGVQLKDIAEVIGRHLNLPVVSKTGDEATEHFGWMKHFVTLDNPTSHQITSETLGWDPTGPKLLEDLEAGIYFK